MLGDASNFGCFQILDISVEEEKNNKGILQHYICE